MFQTIGTGSAPQTWQKQVVLAYTRSSVLAHANVDLVLPNILPTFTHNHTSCRTLQMSLYAPDAQSQKSAISWSQDKL